MSARPTNDGAIMVLGVETAASRSRQRHSRDWYAVNDYAGVEKVATAMAAQIAKLDEEAAKSGGSKKGQNQPPQPWLG